MSSNTKNAGDADRPESESGEPAKPLWPEIVALAAACVSAVLLGCVAGVGWSPTMPDRLTLVRIALAIILGIGLANATRRLRDRATRRLSREWWDPTDGPPTERSPGTKSTRW